MNQNSTHLNSEFHIGSTFLGDGKCRFLVWAPHVANAEVKILGAPTRLVPMNRLARGYYQTVVDQVEPGTQYLYRLNEGKELPDPASRFQPLGVHGPSQVVSDYFVWDDQTWFGLPLRDYIFYEVHVGTFTQEGTFDAAIPFLDSLVDLGITAIEIMPIAQFPGGRNWGYDGVYPFAVQESYGGPEGFKRFVNACHKKGIAVVLDVVFNHLGPEGNYLWNYGPYFTERYMTPWGAAMNFDGAYNDEVRLFFIENALEWIRKFHIDALRLDAVNAIMDLSAKPFLQELSDAVRQESENLNRRVFLLAESDLNDTRVINPPASGGYGIDSQWNDDFHHSLHVLLTDETNGYYEDYGKIEHLRRAFYNGFTYTGEYSKFRKYRFGNTSKNNIAEQFIVFNQNHDQVGNRMKGDRIGSLVCFETLKLAAATIILSPYLPLIFMGEEYNEESPFQYFTSHTDQNLIESVRRGRWEEFSSFAWSGKLPDPQDRTTFIRSKLVTRTKMQDQNRILLEYYKELIRLRKTDPALRLLSKDYLEAFGFEKEKILVIRRWSEGFRGNIERCSLNLGFEQKQDSDEVLLLFNFNKEKASAAIPASSGNWKKILDSNDHKWLGKGNVLPNEYQSSGEFSFSIAGRSFVMYQRCCPINTESLE